MHTRVHTHMHVCAHAHIFGVFFFFLSYCDQKGQTHAKALFCPGIRNEVSRIVWVWVCAKKKKKTEIKSQDRNHTILATERFVVNHMAYDLSQYGLGVLETLMWLSPAYKPTPSGLSTSLCYGLGLAGRALWPGSVCPFSLIRLLFSIVSPWGHCTPWPP